MMCREKNFNFIYKALTIIVAAAGLLLVPVSSFAQDFPCGEDDPTSVPCPLDTWVWVLVIAAMIFGAVQLYRRQNVSART